MIEIILHEIVLLPLFVMKSYQTFTGCHKHKMYHLYQKPYHCQYCDETCVSQGECDECERKHTGGNLCKLDDCDKAYTSRRARNAHVKGCYDEEVSSYKTLEDGTECDQICVNQVHLKQHIRDMHGLS